MHFWYFICLKDNGLRSIIAEVDTTLMLYCVYVRGFLLAAAQLLQKRDHVARYMQYFWNWFRAYA